MPKELLIRGGDVVTVDPSLGDLADADVLVRDGVIVEVGHHLAASASDADLIDARGRLVIPGLVDTHRHVWQGALGGFTPQMTGAGYDPAVLRGIAPRHTPDDIYAGTLWGALQALDAGITTIGDWAHNLQSAEHADADLRGLQESGIRGYFLYGGEDVTAPRRIDVWMGTPESEDSRVVDAQPPTEEEFAAYLTESPNALSGGDGLAALSLPAGGTLALLATVNEVAMRRAGPPAAGALASGRGLAALYASLRHEMSGCPRLLTDDTIGQMSQIQVSGREMGIGLAVRFGVLFQVPCPPRWPFGTPGAFGHDGAGGSLAFCDPGVDVAFGYTVQRLPMPGGLDRRAVELARVIRRCIRAR